MWYVLSVLTLYSVSAVSTADGSASDEFTYLESKKIILKIYCFFTKEYVIINKYIARSYP